MDLFEVFGSIVDRYFEAALSEVEKGNDRDQEAILALLGGDAEEASRVQTVADWIRLYKVHRVKWSAREEDSDDAFADAVARRAIKHLETPRPDLTVPERFRMLRTVIKEVLVSSSWTRPRAMRSSWRWLGSTLEN